MKRILSLSVILLFLCVAVAPSINQSVATASQDDDLVEVTTQVCGIKGYKDSAVKLPKHEYRELEAMCDDIKTRLDNATTQKDVMLLIEDAILGFDRFNVLPTGMSVACALKFVTGSYGKNKKIDSLVSRFNENIDPFNINLCCLVIGQTNHTAFSNILLTLSLQGVYGLYYFFEYWGFLYAMNLLKNIYFLFFFLNQAMPVSLLCSVGLGASDLGGANGWLFTMGALGIRFWRNDAFNGNIPTLKPWAIVDLLNARQYNTGILGFTGIKLMLNAKDGRFFYLGFSPFVDIEWESPEENI